MPEAKEHHCPDDDKLVENIRIHGWAVIIIEATEYLPAFAYTVGLWKNFKHPELIAFGLRTQSLHLLLNTGGELVKGRQKLEGGPDYDNFFENGRSQFIEVDPRNIDDYFGYAIWFNETRDFPALQLVWTDRNDRFPWEEDFEADLTHRQPLLDRNADFKFREARNLAVFTTRQWLEEQVPIVRVVHDEDGDWQFLTGDQTLEDARIVILEQMTLNDPTLNEVFNLNYGEAATRGSIGDKWIRISADDGLES